MASLTVWKFPTAEGAESALDTLKSLQKQSLIQVQDAATVSWPAGAKAPKTKQSVNLAGAGALDGAFWGMLFGLIFFVPFFGLAIGAAIGALAGKFSDYGIDDNFIKQVRTQVTEGTSALFILSTGAVMDKIAAAFQGQEMEMISSNLSGEQEAQLKAAFHTPAQPAAEAPAEPAAAAEEPAA